MRSLRFALVAASLAVTTAFASPTDPKQGAEYTVLATPQPAQTAGKKVEVIEFFMYHCPHCHALEPILEQWVKKQDGNIIFKRIHMPYQGASDPEAHLFLTLQAMGKSEEYQAKVMDVIGDMVRKQRSERFTEQMILDVATKLPGIDKAKFMETWNSFGVMTMLRRLPAIVSNNYKIDSVPTIVVDGKYVTSPAQVGSTVQASSEPQLFQATLQVVDALVAKVQKSK
ncbi:thiol:disulfide interchange protein DsbA/DsbL [Massilia solisilvae]|uniref:Thiol:disulfide interchange protein n=1 Tax=Massilia solisilvae TaxID=1811225 RepID=A0ABT2BJA2_9BURK|nr:thiol:disulfide interchange protein DsbA/DsbL [Massilia solisilvae]MCS0608586.1 thiol:disulfide interchange protein DsbA/DsbL [Massilia solisilvae]